MKFANLKVFQPRKPLEMNGKYKIQSHIHASWVPGASFPSEKGVSGWDDHTVEDLVQEIYLKNEFLRKGKKNALWTFRETWAEQVKIERSH